MAHTCVAPLEFIDRLHPYLCGNCEQWFLKLAQHKRKCPNRDVRSITVAAVAKVSQTHDDVTSLTWNRILLQMRQVLKIRRKAVTTNAGISEVELESRLLPEELA